MKKKMLAMLIAGVIIMGGGVNNVKADEVVSENTYIETEEQAKADVQIGEYLFPDVQFRNYVKNVLNDGSDVLTAEKIESITDIDVSGMNIKNMEGIGIFTNLQNLNCSNNELSYLELYSNTNLKTLSCNNNNLSYLDLRYNNIIEEINCVNNNIIYLNINNNDNLKSVNEDLNSREILSYKNDGKYCVNLNSLSVNKNDPMDFSKISNVVGVNENGQSINLEINSENGVITSSEKVNEIIYNYDLNNNVGNFTVKLNVNNKKIDDETGNIEINEETFPDEVFRNYVINELNGGSTVLTPDKIASITSISVGEYGTPGAANLKGIEYFKFLKELGCSRNKLNYLDISKNTELENLVCLESNLTSLDISNNKKLAILYCGGNYLKELDTSNNPELITLDCSNDRGMYSAPWTGDNKITSLDLSNNKKLLKLFCLGNELKELDLTNNVELDLVQCADNKLKVLKTGNIPVRDILASGNSLETLDLSGNKQLEVLYCDNNNFKTLSLDNDKLRTLWCFRNNLSSLDVSKCINLNYLDCTENNLESLDVSKNINLTEFGCEENKLTSLNISNNKKIFNFGCSGNRLTSIDFSKNDALETVTADNNIGNISPQEKDGEYLFNLNSLNNIEMDYKRISNVKGINENGEEEPLEYDSETGIIKSKEKPVKIQYNYDTKNNTIGSIKFTLLVDKVSVKFNVKDAYGKIEDEILDIGSKIAEPSEELIKQGYKFNGWYKDWDCTEKWNFETDTVTENTILYAGWTSIEENTENKEDNNQEENTGDKEDNKQEENTEDKEDNKQEDNIGDNENNKQEENSGDKENNKQEENKNDNNIENNNNDSSKDNNQSNKENTSTVDKNKNEGNKSESVSNNTNKDKNTKVVKTGDKSLIGILVGLMLGAFGIIIGLFERKERE